MNNKLSLRLVIYLLLVLAFAYALYTYQDQLIDIVRVVSEGVWYMVLAAVLVLALAIYNQATLYASIYQVFELPPQKSHLLPLYLVTRFVMVAAPSGGLSGWVPFIHDARRRDLAVGTVLIANLVYMVLWYSAFAVFLFFGLLYLFGSHDLQWFEISAAIMLLVGDMVMIGGLVLAWIAPQQLETGLHKVAGLIERVAGRLNRPAPLTDTQVTAFVGDLNQAVTQMRQVGWPPLLRPVGHALLNEALNLTMFFLLARAFNLHLSFGVLVAAYSISILFYIISPTPGGLGFVEGTLILVLTTLGVPPHGATVVTLAYRGLTFWLPFVLGFFALRWFSAHPAPETE